jgi:hypothetical protein
MNTPTLPFPRTYWVIPGRFLAGFSPGDLDPSRQTAKLQGPADLGCTRLINLMQSTERDYPGNRFKTYDGELAALAPAAGREVEITRRGIPDLDVPEAARLLALINQIDPCLDEGHTLYLHCWGGRGRTGTVVGSWMARHGEPNAVEKLKTLTAHDRGFFPQIPETPAQRQLVRQWEVGQ